MRLFWMAIELVSLPFKESMASKMKLLMELDSMRLSLAFARKTLVRRQSEEVSNRGGEQTAGDSRDTTEEKLGMAYGYSERA